MNLLLKLDLDLECTSLSSSCLKQNSSANTAPFTALMLGLLRPECPLIHIAVT